MTATEFVTEYIMHDSIMENVEIMEGGTKIILWIDFAFWMQNGYKESEPDTGTLKLIFSNVTFYCVPEKVNWNEVSILECSAEGSTIRFSLINDATDDDLYIVIEAGEVKVEKLS